MYCNGNMNRLTIVHADNNAPREFQMRYFANLSSQPVVLNFTTDPRLNSKDQSYLGSMYF